MRATSVSPLTAVASYQIAQPPREIAAALGEEVGALIARSTTASREAAVLAVARDALLRHLLTQ